MRAGHLAQRAAAAENVEVEGLAVLCAGAAVFAAGALPVFLLGLASGALADIVDRRRSRSTGSRSAPRA